MIRLAASILLWTVAPPSQSMAEICEARALELLGKDAGQVRLAPAARRADGSWAITGIYSRTGEGITGFQCEIDTQGRFIGVARTVKGKRR